MSFKQKIKTSLNEKDVENIYRSELLKIDSVEIKSPYNVDGLLTNSKLNILLEFKYNVAMKNKLDQCNVLIQCIYYLKKFETNGEKLPSLIFVGDINECFVIHSNLVLKYLAYDLDWNIAPSSAYKKNPELLQDMLSDDDITPFVYDLDDNFSFTTVVDKFTEFTSEVVRKIRVTKHNLVNIFDYFSSHVLTKNTLTTNERANLFTQLIVNPDNNYLHPRKKNILTTTSFGEIKINQTTFKSFFKHFEGDLYSPKEKEELTGLVDRLVDDTTRRNKGEFFTPTAFVDLAHKYISDTFGEDWKDKYVVWDCAAGTCNLTRDYKFKELYISTLEQSDLDTAEQMGYNPEAVKFQFDFLNDDDLKLPQALQDCINQGKEILFLINPPYATASNGGSNKGAKTGCSENNVQKLMKSGNIGATSNLYAQFLYKIYLYQALNKNIKIGMFTPPLYMAGTRYKKFRSKFFDLFGFEKGFLFQASHFSGVSKNWGVSFSVLNNIKNQNKFNFDVVDFDTDFELSVKSHKEIYNVDNLKPCSKWVREEIKGLKTLDKPKLSSALNIKQKGYSNSVKESIGFFYSNSNNINENNQGVVMFSSDYSGCGGLSIIKLNYLKCTSLFTARRLMTGGYANWVNWCDEYIAPNEQHPEYQQFQYDSIVYSLFENKSNQSSLRDITYKNKQYNIKNEFFWIDKQTMMDLANNNNYDELYKDAKSSDERHVYKLLFQDDVYNKLSDDAKSVLNTATELLTKSILNRKLMSSGNPDYHLDSWDAGYAQLKLVWKEYFSDDFKAFRTKYNAFADRLRPLVYELGFLKK